MRCDHLVLSINFLLLLCDCFLQSPPENVLFFKRNQDAVKFERSDQKGSFLQHFENPRTTKSRHGMFPLRKTTCVGIISGLLAYSASISPSMAQTLGSKVAIARSVSFDNVQLDNLTKEGAGGGGTVFSADKRSSDNQSGGMSNKVVVKVSWATSANSVRHECEVLKYLEKYNVKGVERCIASSLYEPPAESETTTLPTDPLVVENPAFFVQEGFSSDASTPLLVKRVSTDVVDEILPKKPTTFFVSLYEEDETANRKTKGAQSTEKKVVDGQRTMIVLDPYFQTSKPSRSTLQDITSKSVKVKAVHNLITTMLEMLSAGAAGSDLQPLMDVDTGETLLIDMTEAEIFNDRKELTFDDKQIAGSFIGEMFSLITSDKVDSDVLMEEARSTIREKNGQLSAARDELPSSIMSIINAYTE